MLLRSDHSGRAEDKEAQIWNLQTRVMANLENFT